MAEIETASDAAFNPFKFREPLRFTVPRRRIIALGVVKVEGIYRVPGDSDFVLELRLRIDRINYTPDGMCR
ncbi:uncharacterized protein HD556DRAFT_1439570 [Suillus plorans]|uniref:Uncharacterized protein n=1 Tax=Suillus plorans TaxID=116603 RepID=A0A9P7J2T2_9AGAM|nr:uncharacterized protein HD556DRAFT_1439570 [Suillus plorans]KAG1799902.1 hypothetical protein HD556DRAFT_1439570 [Suillus plorans]